MSNFKTLTIENVDCELLDKQRLALVRITDNLENCCRPEPEDMELVAGLQSMLDEWADKVHRESSECEDCKATGFKPSETGKGCEFCDGTEGGNPPEELIDCAMCDKEIKLEDSWSPGDEAICAKCDTEVTGRNHDEPLTAERVTELVKEMRKECRAAGVRLSMQNLSWGPHVNFYINDFRVGNVTGAHFYNEYREQFDAVRRIREKYYPLLGTEVKGLKP